MTHNEFRYDSKNFDTKPKGFGKRHTLALMGFFGFALSYSLRFNLSIAIVAMVNGTTKPSQKINEILFEKDVCSYYHKSAEKGVAIILRESSNFYSTTKTEGDSYLFIPPDKESPFQSANQNQSEEISPIKLNETHFYTTLDTGEITTTETISSTLLTSSSNSNDLIRDEGVPIGRSLDENSQGEFNWSESEQGFILGSFFWGYIVTQIPGGWLGHRFGGKWPFGIGLAVTALLSILTPAAARFGGFKSIVFVRISQGLVGGITVPCMHALLAKWVPPDERGKLASFAYAGMAFGTAVSLIGSGYIIHFFGWPWVFYITGFVTLLWFIMWTYLIYSTPDEHPRIDQIELKFIQHAIQGSHDVQECCSLKEIPWGKIMRSGPFWAVICGQMTETWGLYTIMTELPTYMKTVLHYDIEENSILSAFPHLLTWAVGIILPQLGDYCIGRHYASIGTVRKTCNTIGMWGSAAALIAVAYSGCDRTITVTLISIGVACTGGVLGGVLVNLIDITPNYAGVLMGITNSAGTIPGVLAPWVAGIIIDNDPSLARWRLVFIITASISFVGNLLFLILASGEEQPWNNPDEQNKKNLDEESNKKPRDTIDLSTFNGPNFYNYPVDEALPMPITVSFPQTETDTNSLTKRNSP